MARTLIIGGGLSGLALAEMLHRQGRDFLVLEGRDRAGGRIETFARDGAAFDMGPAWFWPGQPRMDALMDRLGLERFEQRHAGDQIFETAQGQVQRGRGFAAMAGSWRVAGGLGVLIEALAASIPAACLRCNAHVVALRHHGGTVTATLQNGESVTGTQAVLALPPRVAAGLSFDPPLLPAALASMRAIPTWMAGQAKAIAVYDRPFWVDAGLSGDATSRRGPMVEIHDASPATGGPYALFGFIGIAPEHRRDGNRLAQAVTQQFQRMFGTQAGTPLAVHIKDWAFDPFTATAADQTPLHAHPTYALPEVLRGLWQDQLHFAGTEVAPQFGGYLEGALESAGNVAQHLSKDVKDQAHAD
jgi:monoamine oxidase